jgi:hypothetical protein
MKIYHFPTVTIYQSSQPTKKSLSINLYFLFTINLNSILRKVFYFVYKLFKKKCIQTLYEKKRTCFHNWIIF